MKINDLLCQVLTSAPSRTRLSAPPDTDEADHNESARRIAIALQLLRSGPVSRFWLPLLSAAPPALLALLQRSGNVRAEQRANPRGHLAELRRIDPGKADALTAERESPSTASTGCACDAVEAEKCSKGDAWHGDEGNDDAAIGHLPLIAAEKNRP
jgi:hypothetical protein